MYGGFPSIAYCDVPEPWQLGFEDANARNNGLASRCLFLPYLDFGVCIMGLVSCLMPFHV